MFRSLLLLSLIFIANSTSSNKNDCDNKGDNGTVWNWDVSYVQVSDGSYIYSRTHNLHLLKKSNVTPLVFIHAYFLSSTAFDYFLERFAFNYPDIYKKHIVVEVDFRGHGESQIIEPSFSFSRLTYDIVEVLRYHNISKAVWMGHSMGGLIATHAAIYYPTYVHSVGIFASGPYVSDYGKQLFDSIFDPLTCIDSNSGHEIYVADVLNRGMSPSQELKFKTDTHKLLLTPAKGIINSFATADYTNATITQKVLILSSPTDPLFSPSIIDDLKEMCTGQITSYDSFDYGHFFLFHYIDLIASYIWQWIQ